MSASPKGFVVRAPVVAPTLLDGRGASMNIGIVCYASVGGSGIVATELGKALARRGHQVHFISTETPFRLGEFQAGLAFHQVLTPTYPLFREPQYLLSLSNKIVQVAREFYARHHPCPLRRAARHRGVPVAAGAGRDAGRRRASSPRFTGRTSPSSATIPRTRRSSRSRSISPIASRRCRDSLRAATFAELGVTSRHRRDPELSGLRYSPTP